MEKVKTSRELRCENQHWEIDENKKGDVLKFKDGPLGKNDYVKGNQLIFNLKTKDGGGCYPDDILARARDLILAFGPGDKYNEAALLHIQEAINLFDQRAFEKHKYSHSKEEADYEPPYKKNK